VYYYNNETMENVTDIKKLVEDAGIDSKKIEWVILGFKGSNSQDIVTIYHFNDKNNAKFFSEYMKEYITQDEATETWIVVYLENNSEGKNVFVGTETAIKNARNK